jgi:GTP cyclohydrolase I
MDHGGREKRHDAFEDEDVEYEDDEKNSSERSSSLMRDEAERGDVILTGCEGGVVLGEEEDDVSRERRMNLVEECVRDLLSGLGEDVKREGLLDTPKRVAKAMTFAMKGYGKTARDALGTALFQEPTLSRPITMTEKNSTGEEEESAVESQKERHKKQEGEDASVILVRDVPIFSTSSTSMMPFYGVVHVGYVPKDGYILGLSKVARVAEVFARRMQNPDGLAREIAEAVGEVACASGVGVILETTQLGPRKLDASASSARNVTRYGVGCLSVSTGGEKFDRPLGMTNDTEDYEDEECCEGRWAEFEGLLGMGRAKIQETLLPSGNSSQRSTSSSERERLKAPPKKALEASVRLLKAIGLKSAYEASTSTSSESLLVDSGDDDDDNDDDGDDDDECVDDDIAMRDNNSALADDISLSSYTSFEGRTQTPPSPSNLSTSLVANDRTRNDKKTSKNIHKRMPSSVVRCRSIDEPFSLARCAFNYASMMSESVCGRDVSLEQTVRQNASMSSSSSPTSAFGRCFSSTSTSDVTELKIERDLLLTTTCEHHLLPFHGVVHVAYWHSPGLELDRKLVQAIVSRQGSRLQVQERLTSDLADDFERVIGSHANADAAGVMICISAAHMCMASRGVEKTGSSTCTVATRGKFTSSAKARSKVWQSL